MFDSHIKRVYAGEETGIYVNNVLRYEGRNILSYEWYELGQENPNVDYSDIEDFEIDPSQEEEFNFPDYFDDIPKYLFLSY
jgi:hypothetical protein